MEWRKTLVIFVVVFMLLDVYLLFLLYTKQQENELDALSHTSFEDSLVERGITIDQANFKSFSKQAHYLSAHYKTFAVKDLKSLTKQKFRLVNNNRGISSEITEEVKAEAPDFTMLKNYVATNIYQGGSYQLATYDKEKNEIIFTQHYNTKRFVFGEETQLVFHYEKGYVKSYQQTLLTDITPLEGSNDLISPLQGFESLFQNNQIADNTTVLDVQLGYYILGELESSNVYMPVWYYTVEVNGQKSQLMVDAIEGQVLTADMSNDTEYTTAS